jgi:hypothetical protein
MNGFSEFEDFDAACTRDNLGRLWEMKGDVSGARASRARNPERMICSNFGVSTSLFWIPVILIDSSDLWIWADMIWKLVLQVKHHAFLQTNCAKSLC